MFVNSRTFGKGSGSWLERNHKKPRRNGEAHCWIPGSCIYSIFGHSALCRFDSACIGRRTQLYAASHRQPVRITQQFLDADFADPAVQEVADIWLVLIQHVYKLPLSKAAPVDFRQDRFDD